MCSDPLLSIWEVGARKLRGQGGTSWPNVRIAKKRTYAPAPDLLNFGSHLPGAQRGDVNRALSAAVAANRRGPHYADALKLWSDAFAKQQRLADSVTNTICGRRKRGRCKLFEPLDHTNNTARNKSQEPSYAEVCFGWKADTSGSSCRAMSARSSMRLSILRDIAWREWDPVGLNGSDGGWRRSDAADEYDRYMRRVAGGLQSGEPKHVLVDYLVNIAIAHMGQPNTSSARTRAEATVDAMHEYVENN